MVTIFVGDQELNEDPDELHKLLICHSYIVAEFKFNFVRDVPNILVMVSQLDPASLILIS